MVWNGLEVRDWWWNLTPLSTSQYYPHSHIHLRCQLLLRIGNRLHTCIRTQTEFRVLAQEWPFSCNTAMTDQFLCFHFFWWSVNINVSVYPYEKNPASAWFGTRNLLKVKKKKMLSTTLQKPSSNPLLLLFLINTLTKGTMALSLLSTEMWWYT